MKKTLLFAFLAISLHAFSQNFLPESSRQYPMSNSVQNVLSGMVKCGGKTSGIISEKNFGNTIIHQSPELFFLFAQYDSIYNWVWDPLITGWMIDSKNIQITYDTKNNLTGYVDQIWNGSIWSNDYRYSAIFDANNDQISYTEQLWDGNTWENSEQYTSTYDANHNKTTFLYKIWNGSGWENTYQVTYTYDTSNNQTSLNYNSWNGSDWENVSQISYTYDANNNQIIELDQNWNGSGWEDTDRYTYMYDANNNRISGLDQYWNGSSWENYDQYTYTYDPGNNLLVELVQFWNGITWENSDRYNYSYDSNNNLTGELDQIWNGSDWVNSSQSLYTHDADNFLASESNRYFDDSGLIVLDGDSSYLYFHTVTGTQDITTEDGNINVYPTPTNGKVNISSNSTLSAIEIYNLLGERIYSAIPAHGRTANEINLVDYGKGIYVVNMYEGTNMYSRKIVIQ